MSSSSTTPTLNSQRAAGDDCLDVNSPAVEAEATNTGDFMGGDFFRDASNVTLNQITVTQASGTVVHRSGPSHTSHLEEQTFYSRQHRPRSSMGTSSFFTGASDVTITGGGFTTVGGDYIDLRDRPAVPAFVNHARNFDGSTSADRQSHSSHTVHEPSLKGRPANTQGPKMHQQPTPSPVAKGGAQPQPASPSTPAPSSPLNGSTTKSTLSVPSSGEETLLPSQHSQWRIRDLMRIFQSPDAIHPTPAASTKHKSARVEDVTDEE